VVEGRVPTAVKKGFNWKHRNNCVFYGTSSSVLGVLHEIRDEVGQWCLVGAFGLRALWL
jgi:hypothetical protein